MKIKITSLSLTHNENKQTTNFKQSVNSTAQTLLNNLSRVTFGSTHTQTANLK